MSASLSLALMSSKTTLRLIASIVFCLPTSFCFAQDEATPKWVSVSDDVLKQLADAGKEIAWPGGTAGVAVDPANGDVYMIVPGQGVWKSTEQGKKFTRCDDGVIGGRCETSFSLNVCPTGKRLACFMLDGKGGWTNDAGDNWQAFTDVGRNWDFAAVDWSTPEVKNIFAGRHESGGQVMFSHDGGKSWELLFKDPEFDKSGGLGIFDAKTLVYTQKGKGIQRSTDAGKTWKQVSELSPIGRVVQVLGGTAYWLSADGLLVSTDSGATWKQQGTALEASIGPWLDPKNPKRMVVAGKKGIFQTEDGGESWKQIVDSLPPGADIPKAGWYSNVAWDPVNNLFYVSKMGKPTYQLKTE